MIRNQQEAGKVTTDFLNRLKGDAKDMKLNEFMKTDGTNTTNGAANNSTKEPAKSTP